MSGPSDPGQPPIAISVIQTRDSGPAPLGLDRLELRRPARLDVGDMRVDWLPGLQHAIADAIAVGREAGDAPFPLPPMALLGRPGSGRTYIARQIATAMNVPLVEVDIAQAAGGARLGAMRDSGSPLPPDPVVAMAATRCANPVILVDGLAAADAETTSLLAEIITPGWRTVGSLGVRIDFGNVTWLVAAQSLPSSLREVLAPVDVSWNEDHRDTIAFALIAEAMADLDVTHDELGDAYGLIGDLIRRNHGRHPPFHELWETAFAGVMALAKRA